MKKSLTSAIALSAVCAAGLAGSLADPATAAVHGHARVSAAAAAPALTKFGYKSNVFGTKVIVDNVELRSVKDAAAQQKCTRRVGLQTVHGSLVGGTDAVLPIPNDLVQISPSTSSTQTYHHGTTYGVAGINTIADVSVGGTVAGVATPVIKLQGLQTTANTFNTAGKFKAGSAFTYKGLSLDALPSGNALGDTLTTLLNTLGTDVDDVPAVVNVPVDVLISTLQQVGTLAIPGLGSLSLGQTRASATKHGADADAYALKIDVTATGEDTVLQLGRAASHITDGVSSGVFRSTMSALDLNLGGAARLGNVLQRSLPCGGTPNGKTVTEHVASAQVAGGELLKLSGITYTYRGQEAKGGAAKGIVSTRIADASIPAVGLEFQGIASKVVVSGTGKGHLVKRRVITSIGKVLLNGKVLALKTDGNRQTSFAGGLIEYRKISQDDFYGTAVSALVVTLDGENSIINLGQSAGRVFYK